MQGVVFAAGRGSRMGELTAGKPKPLVAVAGRPMLTDVFERLLGLGVSELIVVVGYEGERIRERYGDAFRGVPVRYAEQPEPEGMADALLCAEPLVDGPFVGMDGDGVVRGDLSRLVERQRRPDVDSTLLLDRVPAEAARSKAICELDDGGRLERIVKEPADPPDGALVAASMHTFTPAVFDACRRVERSPRGEYELADAIRLLAEDGRTVLGVEHDGWLVNVNTPAERREAERRLRGTVDGNGPG